MALVGGQPHNPNNDYEVPNCAEDTVSDIAFSPVSDFMIATSWDGTVRREAYRSRRLWTPCSSNAAAPDTSYRSNRCASGR